MSPDSELLSLSFPRTAKLGAANYLLPIQNEWRQNESLSGLVGLQSEALCACKYWWMSHLLPHSSSHRFVCTTSDLHSFITEDEYFNLKDSAGGLICFNDHFWKVIFKILFFHVISEWLSLVHSRMVSSHWIQQLDFKIKLANVKLAFDSWQDDFHWTEIYLNFWIDSTVLFVMSNIHILYLFS